MIARFFEFSAHGTNARREVVAGLTTFLTMAYIAVVNPAILGKAGLDPGAVFVATCAASGLTTILMGLWARLPVALAPGMGLNAFLAFTVVPAFHGDWRLGLGCVFLSGLAFVVISITPAREWLINALPRALKLSIAAGIGFFLALIGLAEAGIVKSNVPATLLTAGVLSEPKVLLAAAGFIVIFALAARRVIGAVMIGMIAVTIAGLLLHLTPAPAHLAGLPPPLAPTFLQLHFQAAGAAPGIIASTVLVFLLVVMLDTSGTLTAVAFQGKLLTPDGKLPNARRALSTDAIGSMLGALFGTSPVTAYIESSAGIQAGGRSGLTAVVVGLLFLLALLLAPLAAAVPTFATAPALIFVAVLMVGGLKEIDWDDLTEAAPALLTALAIPFTYSIASGIGIGFIAYVAIKAVSGRWKDLNAAVVVIAFAFAAKIAVDAVQFGGAS